MNIAHIDTERGWRGGQQQVLSLIEGLRARGISGIAVVRSGSELERRLSGVVPTMGVQPITEWNPFVAGAVRRRLIAERVDVVHAHTGHAVALAALATRGTDIPSVGTRRVDFAIGRDPLSRWKYDRLTRIVAISEGVRRVLLSQGIAADRIELVPSGVDFRRYENLVAASRADLGVPEDAIVVGQVAALVPHKDPANLVRAIAMLAPRMPRLRAVLVGEGELRGALETLVSELGLRDVVRFLGFRADALSCLRSFDVFCMSSWGEGLGTSILDAMALEVPVAATTAGGIPDMIEDGVTGFLAPPRDPARLAEAIDRALSAPNRREIVAAAKRKAAEFSIERTLESMERVYRVLAGSGGRTGHAFARAAAE